MLKRIFPWKLLLKRTANSYGFIDPIGFLARMRQFSQPSEVAEPIELLRAGVQFHARGLLNTRAIQTNLDWLWPYWVERQFNPHDPSFMPRAFSFSHVNLTHRNWTAVGLPDIPVYPLVDPRGLITPLYDGWSLDTWMVDGQDTLLPAKLETVEQQLEFEPNLAVVTRARHGSMSLESRVEMQLDKTGKPELQLHLRAWGPDTSRMIVAVRPYNPEGIQFIEQIRYESEANALVVNDNTPVRFDRHPAATHFSNYKEGDVLHYLNPSSEGINEINCPVGMCTAAAEFPLHEDNQKHPELSVRIPLKADIRVQDSRAPAEPSQWSSHIEKTAQLEVPDDKYQFLYDAAARTLSLLSANEVVPGPYTYFRFWFRDACLMMNALLALNLPERVKRSFPGFLEKQKHSGYFQSQEGEWDSNGQVLWILNRYEELTANPLDESMIKAASKAVDWIDRKRLKASGTAHQGLLPPGFSAEHFGPNDYYYWDDFWSLSGLRAAENLFDRHGQAKRASDCAELAEQLQKDIHNSIQSIPAHRSRGGIPASPYRRMDSGAIGSMVADYPLQLVAPDDAHIANTAEYLLENCLLDGCFFQDMIHSGKNIYLNLALAQTLLGKGDPRHRELADAVAKLASPTGQWPEAIHPQTDGGCMGDGQHGWAAAEWIKYIQHLFVREEADHLVIGAGVFPRWLQADTPLRFGPTLTRWGKVSVEITGPADKRQISIEADWHKKPASIYVEVPGYQPFEYSESNTPVVLAKREGSL